MATAFNTQPDGNRQLTENEALAFFDAAVRERLNISAKEFIARNQEFKCNPHYETLMFVVPLSIHASTSEAFYSE